MLDCSNSNNKQTANHRIISKCTQTRHQKPFTAWQPSTFLLVLSSATNSRLSYFTEQYKPSPASTSLFLLFPLVGIHQTTLPGCAANTLNSVYPKFIFFLCHLLQLSPLTIRILVNGTTQFLEPENQAIILDYFFFIPINNQPPPQWIPPF